MNTNDKAGVDFVRIEISQSFFGTNISMLVCKIKDQRRYLEKIGQIKL